MVIRSEISLPKSQRPIHLRILERYEWISKQYPQQYTFRDSQNDDDKVNYAQCRDAILRIASYLNANGFKKGETAAIVLPNCWQLPIFMMGAWTAGMTTTAASAQFTKHEIRHQLVDSEAAVVLTDRTLLDKVLGAAEGNTRIKRIICIQTSPTAPLPSGVVSLNTVLQTSPTFDPYSIDFDMDEDVINLPYSSGTTGVPKGVMITHLNFAYTVDAYLHNERFRWQNLPRGIDSVIGASTLAVLPQYHSLGLFTMVVASYLGIQQIMLRKFNLESMLQHVQQFKITSIVIVPAILQMLADSPLLDKYDLSSIRSIAAGSAPLGRNVIDKLKNRLPLQVRQAYGMTELTLGSHYSRLDQPLGSVGKLNADMEMKVLNPETGKECGPMEKGELFLRGPVVMKGYKNRPEETRKSFDKEGFLITGDLVYYDTDGFMYVCERTKELIKVNGAQVAPAELENLLLGIEGVLDCAVVGISYETFGEVPRAYIVRRNGLKEEKIHEYVNEHVAHYKRLVGGISFVETIPRTPTGKILRRQLKEDDLTMKKSKL